MRGKLGLYRDRRRLLYTWGRSNEGQIGAPFVVADTYVNPGQRTNKSWQSVAVAIYMTMAIDSDGLLWATGDNSLGHFGDGTTTATNFFKQVSTASYTSISLGYAHGMGIRTDGTLWGWGTNASGCLGDGTETNRLSPVQIGSDTWLAVEAGEHYTLGLKSNNTLWAWGQNGQGSLGLGDLVNRNTPTQVGSDTWSAISAGKYRTSHAIKSDGTLWGWGLNASPSPALVGDGTTTTRTSPVQISSDSWQSVHTGQTQAAHAIKSDGTLWGWGQNFTGHVGDGTTTQRASPVQIGSDNWLSVDGYAVTCAIRSDNQLFQWGSSSLTSAPVRYDTLLWSQVVNSVHFAGIPLLF